MARRTGSSDWAVITRHPARLVRTATAAVPETSPANPASHPPVSRQEIASQKQRDEMARAIVSAELDKARQRHAELQQQHRQAEPPADRAAQTQRQAAIDRAQRDIDSLKRELDRRPAGTSQP